MTTENEQLLARTLQIGVVILGAVAALAAVALAMKVLAFLLPWAIVLAVGFACWKGWEWSSKRSKWPK